MMSGLLAFRRRRVVAPDGTGWVVSVRWARRSLSLVRRLRPSAKRKGSFARVIDFVVDRGFGTDELLGTILALLAFALIAVLLWFVIWPLLVFALDIVVVVLLVAVGTLIRIGLGRPWTIRAVSATGVEHLFAVRGTAAARRAMDEIAAQLAAGLEPAPAEALSA